MYNNIIPRKYVNRVFFVERLGKDIENIPNPEPEKNIHKRWDLIDRFSYLTKKHLTWKQYKVFELMLQGKTQTEIGKYLSLTQPSINKTIFGNQVVGGKYDGRRHGGILPKLKKYCPRDKIFIKLYKEAYGKEL